MPVLGLISTEEFSTERFKNVRRKVFYDYPNGSMPLTGILSLLPEQDTDDPEFSWYEKRLAKQRTLTATQGGTLGALKNAADDATAGDPVTTVVNTVYTLVVVSNKEFRVGHQIRILVQVGAGLKELLGVVTALVSTTKIQFRALNVVAGIDNGATENQDEEVLVVGSAFKQGSVGSSDAPWFLPKSLLNYTQIFRTSFKMTGTALKTGAKFDATGPYKDKAKEASIYHLLEVEKALLFGERHKLVESDGMPNYTMGGIEWFLRQWELTSNNPYGETGATADTDDNKRIIDNANGQMTEKLYDSLVERAFRVTNNRVNEKLVICGSGALATINQLYKSKTQLVSELPLGDTYGMDFVKHKSPQGTLFYKTHPMFSQNPEMRYWMLILDVHNLMYRYVTGRDHKLLKNRQPNNADFREDEWLGECGLELKFPESHMLIKNVREIGV